MTDYTKKLIAMVKATGQELINRAEELVGDSELVTDFDIWLRFPQNSVPTIEVTKSVASKETIAVLTEWGKDK